MLELCLFLSTYVGVMILWAVYEMFKGGVK